MLSFQDIVRFAKAEPILKDYVSSNIHDNGRVTLKRWNDIHRYLYLQLKMYIT